MNASCTGGPHMAPPIADHAGPGPSPDGAEIPPGPSGPVPDGTDSELAVWSGGTLVAIVRRSGGRTVEVIRVAGSD